MRVVVSCERRLFQTPDGRAWTTTSSVDYYFWKRYLTVFDQVAVVSRIQPVSRIGANWRAVTGPGVSVIKLPNYVGPLGYLGAIVPVRLHLARSVRREDAVILRIPSHVATSLESVVGFRRQPFAAEVVGDVAAALSPGSVDHVLRPLLRYLAIRTVRRQCQSAFAIAYVTEHTLQRSYPPSPAAFSTHYSSIDLPDDYFVETAGSANGPEVKIISVGSMELRYKRFDLLIEAVKHCVREGLDLRLALIGDGRQRTFFENLAHDLGDRVRFLGELPGSAAVRQELLKADLFVLPSVSEGLPRVIIEAMAVGLPCIGTSVGGTPELLPSSELVPPGDVEALQRKIQEVAVDRRKMEAMSKRNLETAQKYRSSELDERREAMYRYVREHHWAGKG